MLRLDEPTLMIATHRLKPRLDPNVASFDVTTPPQIVTFPHKAKNTHTSQLQCNTLIVIHV